ncbi:MAG TPA: NAD(P)-dependent oxidoreductase [Pyrinomonadaceae bacterium]|nr:NAD(P)-dependent oxidoreductase [Pyrinomonadaceae bacterium]
MSTETITSVSTTSINEYLHGLKDKTILVTGAAGYLGSALTSSLQSIRCRIVALVHQKNCGPLPAESEASLRSLSVDLSQSVWLDVLRETRPDVIVNLAAHEHHRNSQQAPAVDLAVNTATVLELLEACRELRLNPRIVLASSANIAGCPSSMVVSEDTPDQPLTLYAINKLVAEQYLRYYSENFNIAAVSLRFANVYGPLPNRQTDVESRVVLNHIMRRALAGGPLYLYRNQNCVRDFVYIDDVIRAICAAATSETITAGNKYIVGSGEGYSLREIVNEIATRAERLNSRHVAVLVDENAALEPIEWRNFIADYSRLRSATGWAAGTKLHQGIDSTLQAFFGGQSH